MCICNIHTTPSLSAQLMGYVNNRTRSRNLSMTFKLVSQNLLQFSGRLPNLEYQFKRLDPEKAHKIKTNGPHQISPRPTSGITVRNTDIK